MSELHALSSRLDHLSRVCAGGSVAAVVALALPGTSPGVLVALLSVLFGAGVEAAAIWWRLVRRVSVHPVRGVVGDPAITIH